MQLKSPRALVTLKPPRSGNNPHRQDKIGRWQERYCLWRVWIEQGTHDKSDAGDAIYPKAIEDRAVGIPWGVADVGDGIERAEKDLPTVGPQPASGHSSIICSVSCVVATGVPDQRRGGAGLAWRVWAPTGRSAKSPPWGSWHNCCLTLCRKRKNRLFWRGWNSEVSHKSHPVHNTSQNDTQGGLK